MFADGRTETIRPVTESSVAWCKAMSLIKGTTREQKILLLKRAINAQTKLKNEAVVGMGWDRHLFGLFACCKELQMDLPNVFKNKVRCWQVLDNRVVICLLGFPCCGKM